MNSNLAKGIGTEKQLAEFIGYVCYPTPDHLNMLPKYLLCHRRFCSFFTTTLYCSNSNWKFPTVTWFFFLRGGCWHPSCPVSMKTRCQQLWKSKYDKWEYRFFDFVNYFQPAKAESIPWQLFERSYRRSSCWYQMIEVIAILSPFVSGKN